MLRWVWRNGDDIRFNGSRNTTYIRLNESKNFDEYAMETIQRSLLTRQQLLAAKLDEI